MFIYVDDKEFLNKAKSACSSIIKELEESLRNNCNTNSQYFLVGSGGRNMVTQNEDGDIDFDYNLNIISCDNLDDCKTIKENVRKKFNKVMKNHDLPDVDDSTSSLTTKKMHFNDGNQTNFSIDLCIVKKDNNKWHRLKHEKTGDTNNDRYYWNETPNSSDYDSKAKKIKTIPEWWEKVRQQYLDIKNKYLQQNDYNHPSFVCYIEAVNNVYNTMKQNEII